jgi:hypothetical protein
MFRKLRALFSFIKHMPWVDEPKWEVEDSRTLEAYLNSRSGRKLGRILLNMTLRTNSDCVSKKKNLEFEAGFANGFRGAISAIESLADSSLHRELDEESELDFPENNGSHTFDDLYRR